MLVVTVKSPPSCWVMQRLFNYEDSRLGTKAFGLAFRNPVGLAAGYDKNGVAAAGLAAIGFGHLEIGTVTRLPQAGNPRPRIHRVPAARASRGGAASRGVRGPPGRA